MNVNIKCKKIRIATFYISAITIFFFFIIIIASGTEKHGIKSTLEGGTMYLIGIAIIFMHTIYIYMRGHFKMHTGIPTFLCILTLLRPPCPLVTRTNSTISNVPLEGLWAL